MNCMQNLTRTQIPNDVIMDYIRLYKSIGNNRHNHDVLEGDYEVMVRQTVRNNTYYFSRLFDVKVSDARFKSLIYKGVKTKNKEERLVLQIYNAFIKIHEDADSFELLVSEIQDLARFLYSDLVTPQKLQFRKLKSTGKTTSLLTSKNGSTRESLEQLIHLYQRALEHQEYEVAYIIMNFYIDFIHINPFYDKNQEVGLMLMFILLLTSGYEVFEYISFFELLYKRREDFNEAVIRSSFNWEMGYAQILPLHQLVLEFSMNAYETLNDLVRDYQFDKHLNKSDNVENTILKLPEIFSKDDIRNVHPYISDSTINRTLKRLRDDKKIRPLGKGRSAKWMKLVETNSKKLRFEQLDLKL
ncbi:hypothetical protein [Candidatus Xianfuyuplasma coldseepsis]|uniref:Fido domain-containing protein n=1 Tax=Candidatus Xianfuyuplasma coldseepsis TaxID=2782163 RepID=A0A7L7KT67_9MOLU|nr:hypothetical protein [Xianfuyuplasma coldseepsis]QMS85897.1 hypothetical protein G4Z02_09095 [Xianfuyuplasma coldseepsis]